MKRLKGDKKENIIKLVGCMQLPIQLLIFYIVIIFKKSYLLIELSF